jgi:hypothetical protein
VPDCCLQGGLLDWRLSLRALPEWAGQGQGLLR